MGEFVLIGVTREAQPGEARVSATPQTVGKLTALGYDVLVESGAGLGADFADEAYAAAGARIGDTSQAWGADVVFTVNAPTAGQLGQLRPGATLIGVLNPALDSDFVEQLAARPITALAMDAVPRISRAQSLDVLSSMANIGGYRAIVEAAHHFGRFFTGQVTAAGKVPPAKVLVVGAGVAGLAAIGAANSLGAIVRATDPRPEVADQVHSLGGQYLSVTSAEAEVSPTGYAKEMSEDYNTRAAELYRQQCPEVDIIVTTALIPGRPAPRLITADMVASMQPGSVIVDMAAAQGGNVAGTVPGDVTVTENKVTIIGYTDLPGRLPAQASQLYGTNLVNLMKLLTPEKDGQLVLDFDDVVQRGITVVREGEKTWPPPPVEVSAAPAAKPGQSAVAPKPERGPTTIPARIKYLVSTVALAALFLLAAFAPRSPGVDAGAINLIENFTVFALAIVIGYYVIGHVHHALHTPLLSVTNAISGIIVVGALLQIGHHDTTITVLSFIAIFIAGINIFGGFTVTRRMLSMFSRD